MPIEKRMVLSSEVKSAISKLETPEAVAVMDHMRMSEGDNQNQNNNSGGGAAMEKSREELIKTIESVPTDALHTILRTHGLV
jgi:hypothetical protein